MYTSSILVAATALLAITSALPEHKKSEKTLKCSGASFFLNVTSGFEYSYGIPWVRVVETDNGQNPCTFDDAESYATEFCLTKKTGYLVVSGNDTNSIGVNGTIAYINTDFGSTSGEVYFDLPSIATQQGNSPLKCKQGVEGQFSCMTASVADVFYSPDGPGGFSSFQLWFGTQEDYGNSSVTLTLMTAPNTEY